MHRATYFQMARIGKGRELNKILGQTARNILVFGITTVLAILSVIPFSGNTNDF